MDEHYMRLALDEALVALEHGDVPVGAVLVRGEDIIARTHNTVELTNDGTAHAELLALRLGSERTGSRRLEGCQLYVTLEPCPMCAGAIATHRVDRLVFGAWNPKHGSAGSLYNIVADPRVGSDVEVVRGVLADECAAPLGDLFEGLRTSPSYPAPRET